MTTIGEPVTGPTTIQVSRDTQRRLLVLMAAKMAEAGRKVTYEDVILDGLKALEERQ